MKLKIMISLFGLIAKKNREKTMKVRKTLMMKKSGMVLFGLVIQN